MLNPSSGSSKQQRQRDSSGRLTRISSWHGCVPHKTRFPPSPHLRPWALLSGSSSSAALHSLLCLTLIVCWFNGPRPLGSPRFPTWSEAATGWTSPASRVPVAAEGPADTGRGQLFARVKAAAGNSLQELEFSSAEVDSSAQSSDYLPPADRLQATVAPLNPPPHPYSPASAGRSLRKPVMRWI